MNERIVNCKDLKIYVREWLVNKEDCQANILFIHGLGEHCSRYHKYFLKFNEHGIGVLSFDLPGHGQTLKINSGTTMGYLTLRQVLDILDSLYDLLLPTTVPIILVHK